MSTMARKVIPVQIKTVGDRQVETIASTASLDRENDRILATAWRLDNYKRTGAPVLWGHDYQMPPVARSVNVRVVGDTLRTVDEFPPQGIYPLADTVHDLVKAGFINSKSVGFRPLKWRPNDEGGRDYTEVELLEHSYVAIPANPSAVVVARSKGLDRARLDAFLRGATRDLGEDIRLDTIPFDRAAIARAARGSGVGLGEDIDLARIPFDARAVARAARGALVPGGADVLVLDDEPDVLRHVTRSDVVGMVREIVRADVARWRAGRGVGRDGLWGGRYFDARSGWVRR